jgi:hypothetical protein
MQSAIADQVLRALRGRLGQKLNALYVYRASGEPHEAILGTSTRLVVVVDDGTSAEEVRDAILPVQQDISAALQEPPIVCGCSAFRRHLSLEPLFADQLSLHGERIKGDPIAAAPDSERLRVESIARLCGRALRASAALVPTRLPQGATHAAVQELAQLAALLTTRDLPADTKPVRLLSIVQGRLQSLISVLPPDESIIPGPARSDDTSDSLYTVLAGIENLFIVFPSFTSRILEEMDLETIANSASGEARSVYVATTDQIRLWMRYEAPLDFALGRFRHVSGDNVLAAWEVPAWTTLRQAARISSWLLIDEIPAAYLAASDGEAQHRVVHDYQNRLLNIGLQRELLHKMYGLPAARPQRPLPSRDQPLNVRIQAILDHLDWWSELYANEMSAVPRDRTFRSL